MSSTATATAEIQAARCRRYRRSCAIRRSWAARATSCARARRFAALLTCSPCRPAAGVGRCEGPVRPGTNDLAKAGAAGLRRWYRRVYRGHVAGELRQYPVAPDLLGGCQLVPHGELGVHDPEP